MYRQGDVLLVAAEAIPAEAQEVPDGVIARGEATGHAHALRPGSRAALLVAAGVAYVRALEACHLDHPEHGGGRDVLPTGDWVVHRQREYTPAGWRRVAD